MFGTAIQAASYKGHERVIRALLNNGVDIRGEDLGMLSKQLHIKLMRQLYKCSLIMEQTSMCKEASMVMHYRQL